MKRRLAILLTLFLVFGTSVNSAVAKVIPGSKCSKAGVTSKANGMIFTCKKSGKKLIWSKGNKIVVPTPTISSKQIPQSNPIRTTTVFPPKDSASAITLPPVNMIGINDQHWQFSGGMDPNYVTLGPKTGTHPEMGSHDGKNGVNNSPLCSNAKEWPGPLRAEEWQFFINNDGYKIGDAVSASCKALLGRSVKRGDVIAYSGTVGTHSQAPITMKVPDKSINPTIIKGDPNLHWVQGDVFFYWKCFSKTAVFEKGVLAYPWECGGYQAPREQRLITYKYPKS